MGEMADYYLDQVMEEEELRLDYICGYMNDLEAYDRGIIDELGAIHTPIKQKIKCKYCAKEGFVWVQTDDKSWRLSDTQGEIHTCTKWRPSK